MDDLFNVFLLRADVYKIFDLGQFVTVPKYGTLCIHVLGNSDQFRSWYHNTVLHPVLLGTEFLLARFAWAIFPLVSGFIGRSEETCRNKLS